MKARAGGATPPPALPTGVGRERAAPKLALATGVDCGAAVARGRGVGVLVGSEVETAVAGDGVAGERADARAAVAGRRVVSPVVGAFTTGAGSSSTGSGVEVGGTAVGGGGG